MHVKSQIKDQDEMEMEKIEAVLLATARVSLNVDGQLFGMARALCDTGAQLNLVTDSWVKANQVPTKRCNMQIFGVTGARSEHLTRKVKGKLVSRFENEILTNIELVVVPEITASCLPLQTIEPALQPFMPTQVRDRLADPEFHVSAPVEMLLGAGVWAQMLQPGFQTTSRGVVAQQSRMGYLIFGGSESMENEKTIVCVSVTERLEQYVQRFWEIEEPEPRGVMTPEQEKCEATFIESHCRDSDGRYIVKIPIREPASELGSSKMTAMRRFRQLQRRFDRDPDLYGKYKRIMDEYLKLGHMRPATSEPVGPCYHIPHHCVTKKFRVVFDASCPSDRGLSLNQVQLVGAKLQRDLFDLIIKFRQRPVAVTVDIKQMYRQIRIDPQQWDLQRIFWQEDVTKPIREYCLTTVTFGMASAPHCAIRAMIQCARDHAKIWPVGAAVVENDFYMDDGLTGASDEASAERLCIELSKIMGAGGFELDKWRSNRANVLPRENQTESEIQLGDNEDTMVLGLKWNPITDELAFRVQASLLVPPAKITKRGMLSCIARLFDPIGFIGPITIGGKILLQELWRRKIKWDRPVPMEIGQQWLLWLAQATTIEMIQIPRWTKETEQAQVELCGFADASTQAYGAVIYGRLVSADGEVGECFLITSKSRVAPIKTLTVPRLELCAAELLSRLMQRTQEIYQLQGVRVFLWTDSEIVLHWLQKRSDELKTFVGNRVQAIKRKAPTAEWRHVSTTYNPADLVSRGVSPNALINSNLWWYGPPFLKQNKANWPKEKTELSNHGRQQVVQEEKHLAANIGKLRTHQKAIVSVALLRHQDQSMLERSSSVRRLARSTAFIFRYLERLRQSRAKQFVKPIQVLSKSEAKQAARTATISTEECQRGLNVWIRFEQQTYYAKEIQSLTATTSNIQGVQVNSSLLKLNPFLDHEQILRVGGRLNNAAISFNQQHPIILPETSRLTLLLAQNVHRSTLHGGAQQTISVLRQVYWIPGVRRMVKTLIGRCVRCFRQRKRVAEQLMGNLPEQRVTPCRAFRRTGVDYAGPFTVNARGGRCKILEKRYVAVFVCMSTKAVHLELAEDLSTAAFVDAFLRFTSIRGACTEVWSDNGTNFVGAEQELGKMLKSWQETDLFERLQELSVNWHYITPSAPHQGGLWEAAVRSMKYHLRRVIGAQTLTAEGLNTVLAQVGAAMNSRPLMALSDDPLDLQALTPAHFLIGESITQPFGARVFEVPDNRLKQFAHRQKIAQCVWQRWSQDYLQELQQRPKWAVARANMKIGDLVLIRHDCLPPTVWKMGRIIETHAGADGRIRTVTLRTETGSLKRPIQKLCLLPFDSTKANASAGEDVRQ